MRAARHYGRGGTRTGAKSCHPCPGAVTMTARAVTMTTSAHHGPHAAARRPAGCANGRARPRDVIRADRSYGRSLPRCCSRRPELPEAARGMLPAPSSAWPASTGALPGISWPLYRVRVFTHGRRTGPCAIARAPGPTAKARVSLQTAEHYVAVEALTCCSLVWRPRASDCGENTAGYSVEWRCPHHQHKRVPGLMPAILPESGASPLTRP